MMGGVEFTADCRTTLEGLYSAGEDTGGVHGANRLGGNGLANSTVFRGIAGDVMAQRTRKGAWREPEPGALEAAEARARIPLAKPRGDLETLREALHDAMWDDVGILRSGESLARAGARLASLAAELHQTGVPA